MTIERKINDLISLFNNTKGFSDDFCEALENMQRIKNKNIK